MNDLAHESATEQAPTFCIGCPYLEPDIVDDVVYPYCYKMDADCPSEQQHCPLFHKGRKVLTPMQYEVLDEIKAFIEAEGYPPSIDDLLDCPWGPEGKFITKRAAWDHLNALEKKGYISMEKHKARTITLVGYRVKLEEA